MGLLLVTRANQCSGDVIVRIPWKGTMSHGCTTGALVIIGAVYIAVTKGMVACSSQPTPVCNIAILIENILRHHLNTRRCPRCNHHCCIHQVTVAVLHSTSAPEVVLRAPPSPKYHQWPCIELGHLMQCLSMRQVVSSCLYSDRCHHSHRKL